MKRLGRREEQELSGWGGSELSGAALSGAGLVRKRAKGGLCQSKLVTCVCVCVRARTLIHVQLCGPSPGSSVHGILQAGTLEWAAILSSKGSSRPTHRTHASCISHTGRQTLRPCITWEALLSPPLSVMLAPGLEASLCRDAKLAHPGSQSPHVHLSGHQSL